MPYFAASCILGCLLSGSSFAETSTVATQMNWRPLISLSIGKAFTSDAGDSNNFPAKDGIFSFFNYDPSSDTQSKTLLGAFVGAEFVLTPEWLLQAGLSYYSPSSFSVDGIVTQGVDVPTQNQYSYQYSILSRQLLVEGKLLYTWKNMHPYVSLGLGTAFNEAHDFEVNIQPPFATFSTVFSSDSTRSFSYNVGLGVDFNINPNARIGLGYRFTDLGKVETGTGIIDTVTTSSQLSQSHLYVNEILAQLTFLLI